DERAAKKARGAGDVASGDLFANEGAGDDLAVEGDGRVDDDFKTVTHTEIAKEFDITGLAMAEAKIIADHDGADLQLTNENFIHKIFRRERRELRREGKHNGGFDAERAKPLEALLIGGNAERRGLRAEDFERGRFKGERGGDGAGILGASHGKGQDALMAEVDAVVIADGDDAAAFCGGETRGPIRGGIENGEVAG